MNVRMKIDVSVGTSSIVLDSEEVEVLHGACEGLKTCVHMYPEAMAVDVSVQAVRVVSPEGTFLHTGDELRRLSQSTAGDVFLPLMLIVVCVGLPFNVRLRDKTVGANRYV